LAAPLDGADVDDAASAAATHVRQDSLREEQGCAQIDGHHEVPLLCADRGDAAFEHDAGVVDEDVNAA